MKVVILLLYMMDDIYLKLTYLFFLTIKNLHLELRVLILFCYV